MWFPSRSITHATHSFALALTRRWQRATAIFDTCDPEHELFAPRSASRQRAPLRARRYGLFIDGAQDFHVAVPAVCGHCWQYPRASRRAALAA
jgi:hypothetical protein